MGKENTSSLFFIEATGRSMHPFVRQGDALLVKKVSCAILCKGDIVVYKDKENNCITCHRLFLKRDHRKQKLFFLKGDMSDNHGVPVMPEAIMGKVIGIYRDGCFFLCSGGWRRVSNYCIVHLGWVLGHIGKFCRMVCHKK